MTRAMSQRERDIQRIRRVTPSPSVDAPDPLIELAIELSGECDGDSCFAISIDALLDGLGPASDGLP